MKSNYKEIGFGKQTIAKVFEEWLLFLVSEALCLGK